MSYIIDDKFCSIVNNEDKLMKPSLSEVVIKGNYYEGDVILEPLENGYGLTLGTALRRIMLSSLSGPAVYGIEIDGVSHEFAPISGVKEDVINIVLNISKLCVKLFSVDKKCLYLKAKGPCEVRASMIECDSECTIVNDNLYICTLDRDIDFKMKIYVDSGKAYTPTVRYKEEQIKFCTDLAGFIRINALYNSVSRVSLKVESSRIGQVTNYDKLIMSVRTNGSLSPEKAVALAAKILREQLLRFISYDDIEVEKKVSDDKGLPYSHHLLRKVDELEFSVRANNCLKSENIVYVGDLVQKTDTDMLKAPNFGKRTLDDIKKKLSDFGLSLGMSVPKWPPNNIEELVKKHIDE